jgi:hypothetical protein
MVVGGERAMQSYNSFTSGGVDFYISEKIGIEEDLETGKGFCL